MIEVREVLRRFGAGQSKRRIGRETGAGRNTVDRYVAAAAERGFSASSGEPSAELVEAVVRAVQERPLPEPPFGVSRRQFRRRRGLFNAVLGVCSA